MIRPDPVPSWENESGDDPEPTDKPAVVKQEQTDDEFPSRRAPLTSDASNNDRSNHGEETARQTDEAHHELDELYETPLESIGQDKANALRFSTLVERMETCWKQRKKTQNKPSKDQLLEYLLPPKLKKILGPKQSPFPILRLILPDLDTTRPHTGMKEKTIAMVWAEAMGLGKGTSAYEKLLRYHDPDVAGPTAAGDLSVALYEVMKDRYSTDKSGVTIGQIHALLDELVAIKAGHDKKSTSTGSASHDWRESQSSSAPSTERRSTSKKKTPSIKQKRIRWVEKLIRLKLGPYEHKWIVRILLQKTELGLGYKSILKYCSPYSLELYSANNNLRKVCATISDPEWIRRREARGEYYRKLLQDQNRQNYLTQSAERASLNNTLAPMLANRTSFATVLTDIGSRHRKFSETLDEGDAGESSLALKFPTFACEVKLDGERMVAHIHRGVITMQTRNATWYSHLYSPVIGPALRKAIGNYDVDVILDAEIISWDDARKEAIPFGVNRTIAKARGEWLRRHGKLEDIDLNLHDEDEDVNVMSTAMFRGFDKPYERDKKDNEDEPGSDCWLKLVLFDILYVGGPDADKLLSLIKHPFENKITPGSILNLDCFQRKKILYHLIEPQENMIEIVEAMVIRSDASRVNAVDYFSTTRNAEHGYDAITLDSTQCALNGAIPNLEEVDNKRRAGRTDAQIDQDRAQGLELFYAEIVDRQCQEGLIFKDLSTPYILGDTSRGLQYWLKLKADYEKLGHASDIDAIVLGAFYATGLSRSGQINHFLMGCLDPESPGKYMTLCKISGGGIARKLLDKALKLTGFKTNSETQAVEYGKWFKETDHGKSLPHFVSERSYQRSTSGDDNGWKFDRASKYPDLWIEPDDSFVITINAGEIVTSDTFSAGVTLRFPRIGKIRADGFEGGAKPSNEVESVENLHQIYFERLSQISQIANESGSSLSQEITTGPTISTGPCRFLTYDQSTKKRQTVKTARRSAPLEVKAARISTDAVVLESNALKGRTFTVFVGNYSLRRGRLDAKEAEEQGWWDAASKVESSSDVIDFIRKHGGKCELTGNVDTDFIVGGKVDDARVVNHGRAMDAASSAATKLNDKTKRGVHFRKILNMGGVIKWTFLFKAVYGWMKEMKLTRRVIQDGIAIKEEGGLDPTHFSIDQSLPKWLKPRRHDYLLLSKAAIDALRETEDEYGVHLFNDTSFVDFKRALREVGIKRKADSKMDTRKRERSDEGRFSLVTDNTNWQHCALTDFEPEERCVLAGRYQLLWPYSEKGTSPDQGVVVTSRSVTVLYPNIFADFGHESEVQTLSENRKKGFHDRWKDAQVITEEMKNTRISACLPLVKAMGAQVTCHLHSGVTHVLCDLSETYISIEWTPEMDTSLLLKSETKARALHERLSQLRKLIGEDALPVMLVSPQWVRNLWASVT